MTRYTGFMNKFNAIFAWAKKERTIDLPGNKFSSAKKNLLVLILDGNYEHFAFFLKKNKIQICDCSRSNQIYLKVTK